MSTLKFTHAEHWQRIENHLAKAHGERFAFAFTDTLAIGPAGPVVEVVDIALIDDADTEHDDTGWYVSDRALDRIHNQAITTGTGLAEFHNHRHGTPRFSPTDEHGLQPTADYVLDLLPTHPYIAGVWAESQLHCEWWGTTTSASPAERSTTRSQFDTVTVIGPQLRVLNATPAGPAGVDDRFERQLPLLTGTGRSRRTTGRRRRRRRHRIPDPHPTRLPRLPPPAGPRRRHRRTHQPQPAGHRHPGRPRHRQDHRHPPAAAEHRHRDHCHRTTGADRRRRPP
jgi:hypothetical protein